MKIEPKPDAYFASHKQYSITGLTSDQIDAKLGFRGNHDTDADKVVSEWRFAADGAECAVWDYKGSHLRGQFSAWGDRASLKSIFGDYLQ